MSISQNNLILKDDFNALFARIEAVRTRHVNAGASIANTYASSSVTLGATVKSSDVTTLNNALVNLSNSPWIDASFTSGITIPSVGSLIEASSIGNIESKITVVEGLATGFTSANSQGNFSSASREGDFGNFTSENREGNFSNFTSGTKTGHFTANFTSKSEGCFNSNDRLTK